jgi:4-hydroxy-tetrahydrodipicolinate synthase
MHPPALRFSNILLIYLQYAVDRQLSTHRKRRTTAMSNTRWKGIFPAITTKFHADERIDAEATARHIDFQIRNGIHGLVTCGSLGEASTLSLEEKLQVAKIALDASGGRVPVLANVSETRTAEALRYIAGANELGVDGFMVMPSVIYVADAREAMLNVRTMAEAARKPIMVYNNPVSYRVDLKPEHMAELADCEWIVAIKESTDDIRRITDLRNTVGDRYQLFLGVDDLAYEGLALGCDGLLAGVGSSFPRETVALYELMLAGKFAEALRIYQWMTPMLHLDVSTKLVQNLKLIETLVGVGNEHMRRPRLPLIGAERERVEAIVRKALATRPVQYQSAP